MTEARLLKGLTAAPHEMAKTRALATEALMEYAGPLLEGIAKNPALAQAAGSSLDTVRAAQPIEAGFAPLDPSARARVATHLTPTPQ